MPLAHALRRARTTRRVALRLVTLLAVIVPAGAQQPPSTLRPAAAPITHARFASLRWLEGSWRGRLPDGGYFYERYRFLNDSTIGVFHFPDSTLARVSRADSIRLRGGTVRYERATAARVDSSGVEFVTGPNASGGFTWARTGADAWTATIRRAGQGGRARTVVYRMERFEPRGARPADDRAAVRRAVLDYVEGFYEGDTAKLVRSVWPEVRKYGYARGRADGTYRGMAMPFPAGFVEYAKGVRTGRHKTPAKAPKEITLFDVQDQTASAKLTAWWGTDYLLLAKEHGRWMITHVLWQTPPQMAGH